MSDVQENLDDVFEDGAAFEEEVENTTEEQVEQEQVEPEAQPIPRGYLDKEAWIAAGKDPDKWVSPEVFEERGERIKLKQEMDRALKNQALLHQLSLNRLREELQGKRDDAIESADKEAVKRFDKKLKDLDDQEKLLQIEENQNANQASKPVEILEWEADNPWSANPNDPRLKFANAVFARATKEGKSMATALRMVDREIAEKFTTPQSKPRQMSQTTKTAAAVRDTATVTMDTLTSEERKYWNSGLFDDEKDFLKLVAIERKAAKK